ncbi:hypothetical protein C8039_11800 [Halogeometricum sp. wsp3]|nr:hypothetical protein C8039_11800 [Halogeometricum sp. wsp3]
MDDLLLLEDEIARLRDQRQRLNSEISDLQSLIQYNEERLEEEDYDVIQSLEDAFVGSDGAVISDSKAKTRNPLPRTSCSTVDRDQIEDTVAACRSSAGRRSRTSTTSSRNSTTSRPTSARPKRSSAVARTSSGRSRRRKRRSNAVTSRSLR